MDSLGVCSKLFTKFHFDSTTTGNDRVVLQCPSDNHDSIVEGSLSLVDELFCSTSQYEGTSFGLGAPREQVVPVVSDLNLFKQVTLAHIGLSDVVDSCKDCPTTRLHCSVEILLRHSARTEDIPVSEILGCHIADWQF